MSHNFKGRLWPPFFLLTDRKKSLKSLKVWRFTVDARFKKVLEEQITLEKNKIDEMLVADINGSRISKVFASKMQEKMNEIAQITDTQVLLTNTIALLRKTITILEDSIIEVNVSRREQQGRINSIQELQSKFGLIEKEILAEEAAKEEVISPGSRKIGERPEKLKNIRGTQDSENQPSFLPQQ